MKAIQISEFGDAVVLRPAKVPEPLLREGEVLVEVKASGVNYADILMRSGRYGVQHALPFVPGFEAAGVVLDTAAGVLDWKRGDRVMGTVLRETCGCYAEKAVMPARLLMRIPKALSFEEGAAFPEVFITAYLALHVFGRLGDGEDVLIQAAGGGVGTAAVQLAHAMGARVFGTAGSDEKLRKVEALGADYGINYRTQDFTAAVKKLTDGQGVDLILESVGGEVFEQSLKCLRPLGRLVAYGTSSGKAPALALGDLIQGMISLAGFSFGALSVRRPELIRQCMRGVMEFLSAGKVRPVVGHLFPLDRASAAHELIASRGSFGKVVLKI